MLSHKAALGGMPVAIRQAASRHIPVSSLAFTRIASMNNNYNKSTPTPSSPQIIRFLHNTTLNQSSPVSYPSELTRRWKSAHSICENIDTNIAKDLSPEDFDNAYKYVYHQHSHPHGPWLKTLTVAEHVLNGIHRPHILVMGSGPGEPAATLAANFPDAEVTSSHSTRKCVDWASERFHKHNLSNATARLIPSMEKLGAFADRSFDMVVSCYGLANTSHPQSALNEIHRVLRPGGIFAASVWENVPSDPASDIILRHACVGPHPWHKGDNNRDVVGDYACPLRSKQPMSLGRPHVLENMLEEAKLPVAEVSRAEYPLHLGKDKAFAFKALTLPIRSELQVLQDTNHYHCEDAAEAFEDVLKEGFMAKMDEQGDIEVPYNLYKYVVARRDFEDGDMAKLGALQQRKSGVSAIKAMPIKPADICVEEDPVIFDTWNRMKSVASSKIVKAVKKQIDGFQHDGPVMILDAAPTAYGDTVTDIASSHPSAVVVATSKSVNVVNSIQEMAKKHRLENVKVKALDASHMTSFDDKTFDVIVCSFGLAFLSSPTDTLKEFHRLLKPGGSLIVSAWEDFSLHQLSDFIVNEMHANGSLEDFIDINISSSDILSQLTPYAKPREIEGLLSDHGFNLTHVDHETARIVLSDASCKLEKDYGVNVATLAIRPFLKELETTGANKNAFTEAKKAFEQLLRDPSLVSHDACGNLVTTLPSRFKVVTALRGFEDSDGYISNTGTSHKHATGRKGFRVSDIPK